MTISRLLLFCMLSCYTLVHADTITIRNLNDKPVYAAIYKVSGKSSDGKNDSVNRVTDMTTIPVRSAQKIERPGKFRCGLTLCDRDLYMSYDQAALASEIRKDSLTWVNVGDAQGTEFLISGLGEDLYGFSLKESDLITLHNETDQDFFVAVYYLQGTSDDQKGGDAFRFNEPVKIPKKSLIQILRPPQVCKHYLAGVCSNFEDRDLYVSLKQEDLKPVVPKGSVSFINIGLTQGSEFYITQDGEKFTGYNNASWLARPVTQLAGDIKNSILTTLRKTFEEHEHTHLTASVRTGNDLAIEEKRYLVKRLPRAKQALEKLLGMQLANNELPRIAFCGSGGGYRAMLATLGSLQGAQEIGLLDASIYNVGVSGSTWAIAGALQSGMAVQQYIEQLANKLTSDLVSQVSPAAATQILQGITKRLAFDQAISIIDLYGGLLAEKLLRNFAPNPQDITLADQVKLIDSAAYALPIYTALIDQPGAYEWIEYTPYEVGSATAQTFIPSWSLGRAFSAGKSQDFAPALSLGFCMGTWGSAISVNAQDALQSFKTDAPPTFELLGIKIPSTIAISALELAMKKTPQISERRIYPAQVANWMQGLEGPLKNASQLTLIDAGIDFNLPIPPLLRTVRNISVIIILDASGTTNDAPELRKAEQYARKNNLKFPTPTQRKFTSNQDRISDKNGPEKTHVSVSKKKEMLL